MLVTPSTHKTLKILAPTMFPIAISLFFFKTAITDVTSSGRLVPIATIDTPITVSETLNILAITIAPSTTHLPPKKSAIIPATISSAGFNTGVFRGGKFNMFLDFFAKEKV